MSTKKFAIDKKGKKIYIGSMVRYNNKTFLIEEMQYLPWNRVQYVTLVDKRNKNKKIEFVLPAEVTIQYKTN
jgi:hypothetical protein